MFLPHGSPSTKKHLFFLSAPLWVFKDCQLLCFFSHISFMFRKEKGPFIFLTHSIGYIFSSCIHKGQMTFHHLAHIQSIITHCRFQRQIDHTGRNVNMAITSKGPFVPRTITKVISTLKSMPMGHKTGADFCMAFGCVKHSFSYVLKKSSQMDYDWLPRFYHL